MTALPDDVTLDQIRRELRHLVAMADSAERPKPTRINPPEHPMPGHEWVIEQRVIARSFQRIPVWVVRTVDDPESSEAVYVCPSDVKTPNNEWDFLAMPSEDARRLAMALLAAADRADHLTAGVPRLQDRRGA
jgi:hypothetical protein